MATQAELCYQFYFFKLILKKAKLTHIHFYVFFFFSLNLIRSVEECGVHFSRSVVHSAHFDLLDNRDRFFHDLFLNLKEKKIWKWSLPVCFDCLISSKEFINIITILYCDIFNKFGIWSQRRLVENLQSQTTTCCYCLLQTEDKWGLGVKKQSLLFS